MDIGIIASDKDNTFYGQVITQLGYVPVIIKNPHHLEAVKGLIICGEEGDLRNSQLIKVKTEIYRRALSGMAVFGIAGGVRFMASCHKPGKCPSTLGLMDITVSDEIYCQRFFQTELNIPALGAEPVEVQFKKAPLILECQPNVGILAVFNDRAVLARQGDFLVSTFYPVLTKDFRVLEYFVEMVQEAQK